MERGWEDDNGTAQSLSLDGYVLDTTALNGDHLYSVVLYISKLLKGYIKNFCLLVIFC